MSSLSPVVLIQETQSAKVESCGFNSRRVNWVGLECNFLEVWRWI